MRSTAGQFLRTLKGKFQHGLRTAYYRDIVCQRILQTRPVVRTDNPWCEVHVMTSKVDWLLMMWALKTFYAQSRRHFLLCIHDDGTVPPEAADELREHFPKARFIDGRTADNDVGLTLKNYPLCNEFRETNHLAPKVFDFAHFAQSDRIMIMDSDVLFFSEPTELLRRIEDKDYKLNTVNRDLANAYTVDPALVESHLGFELIERFNSGLGLIHRASIRLDWIEEFLKLPGIIGHFWRIEQTMFALCSSKFGCELLPPEYDVRMGRCDEALPSRHYIGLVRHLMYDDGIRKLVRGGFLSA
jgi:hypothetical protein